MVSERKAPLGGRGSCRAEPARIYRHRAGARWSQAVTGEPLAEADGCCPATSPSWCSVVRGGNRRVGLEQPRLNHQASESHAKQLLHDPACLFFSSAMRRLCQKSALTRANLFSVDVPLLRTTPGGVRREGDCVPGLKPGLRLWTLMFGTPKQSTVF